MSEPIRIDESVSTLVREAQAGDEPAFERLVRLYYGRVHRWALAKTGDGDDADDVAQEALLRMHRGLANFDGRSHFTTWMYQVTRSAAADLHRRHSRRRRLKAQIESHTARDAVQGPQEESLDRRRVADLVKAFLEELSERQREVFDLVDLQGLGSTEVGAMLGMEPVTVRSHLLRARRAIRARILESHPELVEGYGD